VKPNLANGLAALVAAAVAIYIATTGSRYVLDVAAIAAVFAIAAQGWNLMGGFAGEFSFGHAAFFGTGAYAQAYLVTDRGWNPYLAVVGAIVIGGLFGLIVGWASFRFALKGPFFALSTFAFAEALRITAVNVSWLGGARGILMPLDRGWGGLQPSQRGFFLMASAVAIGLALAIVAFSRTRWSLTARAMREDITAAQSLGVPIRGLKVGSAAASAAITGLAGALYAQNLLFVDPKTVLSVDVSLTIVTAALVGGIGTVWGPICGVVLLTATSEAARTYVSATPGTDLIVYGLAIIVFIRLMPQGVVGTIVERTRRRERRDAGVARANQPVAVETTS
jgi:branched-chain amino acid transport system permease protein